MDIAAKRRVAAVCAGSVVLAAVAVLLAGQLAAVPAPHWGWWLVGAGLVTLSEKTLLRFSAQGHRWTLSLTDSVVAAALVLQPGLWVAVSTALGMTGAQILRAQRDPWKFSTNVLLYLGGVAAGATVALATTQASAGLGDGPARMTGALVGTGLWWAFNYVAIGYVISTASKVPIRHVVVDNLKVSAGHAVACTSVGAFGGWAIEQSVWASLGLIAPIAILHACFAELTRRLDEKQVLTELVTGQEQVRRQSADESAQVVVLTASRVMGTPNVRMVLFAHDGPRLYEMDETDKPVLSLTGPDVLDAPWVLAALAGPAGVTVGHDASGSFCTIQIGPAERPIAVLSASQPHDKASEMGDREARLGRFLRDHAEGWLSAAVLSAQADDAALLVAARGAEPDSPLGAPAPELLDLKESIARLLRLAEVSSSPDPLLLVHELNRVEEAIAGLLGAASPAELSSVGAVRNEPEPDLAWVSTGRLPLSEPHAHEPQEYRFGPRFDPVEPLEVQTQNDEPLFARSGR